MLHPDIYLKQTNKGFGLFAKRKFSVGEIIWILDEQDVQISLSVYENIDPNILKKLNTYTYMNSEKRVIIPWDEGKYLNHSCSPNVSNLEEFEDICVVVKTIEPDEEILEDYGTYTQEFGDFSCVCGSSNCRGQINQNIRLKKLNLEFIGKEIVNKNQQLLTFKKDLYATKFGWVLTNFRNKLELNFSQST